MEIFLLFVIIILLLTSSDPSKVKLEQMDKKLDRIMDHLGIEKPNIDEELKELIEGNQKIQAIKRLREETGMELKEAKEYVDNLENNYKSLS